MSQASGKRSFIVIAVMGCCAWYLCLKWRTWYQALFAGWACCLTPVLRSADTQWTPKELMPEGSVGDYILQGVHQLKESFSLQRMLCRCVGPVLTVVAAMAHGRPVFQSPPDRREEAELAKKRLTGDSAAARSDHLALVAAFSEWNHARTKDGRHAAFQVSILFPLIMISEVPYDRIASASENLKSLCLSGRAVILGSGILAFHI